MVSILGTNKQFTYKCKTAHDHLTVKKNMGKLKKTLSLALTAKLSFQIVVGTNCHRWRKNCCSTKHYANQSNDQILSLTFSFLRLAKVWSSLSNMLSELHTQYFSLPPPTLTRSNLSFSLSLSLLVLTFFCQRIQSCIRRLCK